MIKKLLVFLVLFLFDFCANGMTTTTVFSDTPIAYKRHIEVITVLNEGQDIPLPFYFTMVWDTRIPPDQCRVLMGAPTFTLPNATTAHEEGIAWAKRNFAHLRVTIPENNDGLVLRFLEPTNRHNHARVMDFERAHSDPSSRAQGDGNDFNPMQRQLILAAPPELTPQHRRDLEEEPNPKRQRGEPEE
jgi:hypothetical protein